MAYNAYLVSGNAKKDNVLPLSDFVPKWQATEEGETEVSEERLRTKVAAAFGVPVDRRPSG